MRLKYPMAIGFVNQDHHCSHPAQRAELADFPKASFSTSAFAGTINNGLHLVCSNEIE